MMGITEACDARGIGISLISAANEDVLAWSIKSAVVDGLILFCIEDADRLIAAARERRLPFVTLSFGDTDDEVSVVGVDDVAGARLAAEHLTGLGHRRFAVLSMELGPEARRPRDDGRGARTPTTPPRGSGSRATSPRSPPPASTPPPCRSSRPPPTWRPSTPRSRRSSPAPGRRRRSSPNSDRIAMQALRWLKARGIAVPGQVSVIGFDGVPEGAATEPPLTTIRQPSVEMGRRAVAVLADRGDAVARETLPVELVERASTAPPPKG